MKATLVLLLFPLTLGQMQATDQPSLEDFKKLFAEGERRGSVQPGMQQRVGELREEDRVRMLKQKYGGEKGWREHEEYRRLDALGLSPLVGVFVLQNQLSNNSVNGIVDVSRQTGVSEEQLRSLEEEVSKEADRVHHRYWSEIRPVLVTLADSPEALALAKRAAVLLRTWNKRFKEPHMRLVTRDDLRSIERSAESIRKAMEKLPRATPEQIQEDIAALPKEHPSR